MPEADRKRVEGWRRLCPEYEIKRWDESDFDVKEIFWTRAALKRGNYAMASDAVRAKILYEEGGIYMDTDMELLKPLDEFLRYDNFAGFESSRWLGSAIMGAQVKSPWAKAIFEAYRRMKKWTEAPNVHLISILAREMYGVQLDGTGREYKGFVTFDRGVFYPIHYATREDGRTEETVGVHHFSSTWWNRGQKLAMAGAKMIYEAEHGEKLDELAAKAYEKKVRKAFLI